MPTTVPEPPHKVWKFLESNGLKVSFRSTCWSWLYNGKSVAAMHHAFPYHPKEEEETNKYLHQWDFNGYKEWLAELDQFTEHTRKSKILGEFMGYVHPTTLVHELGHFLVASELQRKTPEWGLYPFVSDFISATGGLDLDGQSAVSEGILGIPNDVQVWQEDVSIWIEWKLSRKLNLEWNPADHWDPFQVGGGNEKRAELYFSRENDAKAIMYRANLL